MLAGKIRFVKDKIVALARRALDECSRDWLLLLDAVVLIRARREEDISVSYSGVAGCLIAGIIMAVAKPLVTWLTGIDPSNPAAVNIPHEVAQMFDKLLNLVMYLGVIMVVIGLIWAGINLRMRAKYGKKQGGC